MNTQNEVKEPEVRKKEYTSPKLKCYGTLADITRGQGNLGDDGIVGSKSNA